MGNVWLTSDLHLGHHAMAIHRGFDNVEDHDNTIICNLASMMDRKSKLFILGDVTWHHKHLPRLAEIPGIKELIMGNHDALSTKEYLKYFNKVHGFRQYKKFWLSHCPIHPQEVLRCTGNIHGHLHNNIGFQPHLSLPYFNVNVDFNSYHPVNFDLIQEVFDATASI